MEPICVEYDNGTKIWHVNNKYHREDGPAVEWADGTKEWHINGVPVKNPPTTTISPLCSVVIS